MTDTNDLREQVARAMHAQDFPDDPWDREHGFVRDDYRSSADAALAVAEPAIRADERRKVIEELIAAANEQGVEYVCSGYASSPEEQMDIANWLRAQKESE
jgi:hypothetical protein